MNVNYKIHTHRIIIFCVCALLSLPALAQNRQTLLEEFAKPVTTNGWIDFREGNTLDAQTLFINQKQMFGLTQHDDMQQYKVQSDEIGFTHFRFQQYHKGVKIIGAEAIVHHNGQYLKSANGHLAENLDMKVVPTITTNIAFDNAKASLKNVQYYVWEHPDMADALSKNSNGQKDFSKPKAELVICRKNMSGNFASDNLNLAYYFRMVVLPSNESKDVYVDAITGEIINKIQLAVECNNNTGNTSWYGSKNFTAAYFGWPNNNWFLEVQCSGEALIRSRRGDPILPYNYGDANGAWTDPDGTNGYNMRAGVTTFYGMRKTYDYFRYNHGRFSYNNSNGNVDAYSEILGGLWNAVDNAKWDPVYNAMFFGAGATNAATDDINSIDIVGHEFTHGVVQYSAGLVYQGESGALNESFADIFGECIEYYSLGMMDWINGFETGFPVRNYANPNAYSQPDTYMGDFWFPPSGSYDNGGVHINSGIQNYWFYLLTMGGSGINDTNQTFNVAGIGLTKAAQITYRNLNNYLTSSSNFFDSREGSLRAATDLFGWCSNEVLQTARAWYAVGVATVSPDWNYVVPCGNVPPGSVYRGINSLATSTTCTTTLLTGSNAIFTATATGGVTLKPGFTAAQGCAFTAIVDACNEAAFNRLASNQQENTEQAKQQLLPLKLVSLYPNPANNRVTIQYESQSDITDVQISIVDISGRSVNLKPTNTNEYHSLKTAVVDVKDYNAGIYFIYIRDKNSSVNHKLVITQ